MSQVLKNAAPVENRKAVPSPDCPFLICVDDALSVFGDSVKQAIYYYLETDHNLTKEMIPIQAEAFEDAIEAIFNEGAKMILHLVVKNSYNKAGLEPPPETYHISSLRKIRRRLSEVCSLKRKECPVRKCAYFDGDEEENIE